jgi:hypothetical protein
LTIVGKIKKKINNRKKNQHDGNLEPRLVFNVIGRYSVLRGKKNQSIFSIHIERWRPVSILGFPCSFITLVITPGCMASSIGVLL